MSPIKFAHLAEESENGSISNLLTKVAMEGRFDFDLKFWAGLTSLVVYFDARFSDGTVLHTGPLEEPTHWKQTVLLDTDKKLEVA